MGKRSPYGCNTHGDRADVWDAFHLGTQLNKCPRAAVRGQPSSKGNDMNSQQDIVAEEAVNKERHNGQETGTGNEGQNGDIQRENEAGKGRQQGSTGTEIIKGEHQEVANKEERAK